MNWYQEKKYGEQSEAVHAFLEDIFKVYQKHNLSISHEDTGGAFIITRYDEDNIDWLKGASDET